MLTGLWDEIGERLSELPQEIGTEAVAQVKGSTKQTHHSGGSSAPNPSDQANADAAQQQYLQDLYGSSSISPQQLEIKRQQDNRIIRNRYNQIQEEIRQYRLKKAQEKSKYEIGWQSLEGTARTKEEEYELWELEQQKAKKKKDDQDAITLPGSKQGRSGEQQKIMG